MVRIPAELSLALGSAHFRRGEREPAEESYRAALRTNNGLGAAHNNLAFICMITGRLDEARKHLRQAEEAGFRVDPGFKKDLSEKIASGAKE
jgi:Flp pilus assembly protein TadD